nr:hypothetical protein 12 [Candidatus Omnitrophota bacterium]
MKAYQQWLETERYLRNPARDQNIDHCIRCGFCCLVKTCVPLPDEIPAIAAFLKMSIEDMIKKYMVGDEFDDHYYLRWANEPQIDIVGTYLPDERTFDRGQCLMFDEEKKECRIHTVKPYDAKKTLCGVESDNRNAMLMWNRGDLEKFAPWMANH